MNIVVMAPRQTKGPETGWEGPDAPLKGPDSEFDNPDPGYTGPKPARLCRTTGWEGT